jgi:nucleoside-diphosphate-sugar epimerase
VLLSSAAVYGNPVHLPVSEAALAAPVSPYGFHKVMQETLVDEYHQVFGIPAVKARVFSTFGEGLRKLAVWEIARRALNGDTSVHGTGEEIRDYLYAGDVARALVAIAERGRFEGEAINVASGNGNSVRELANAIFDALNLGRSPEFDGVAPRGTPISWIADVTRLSSLGFAPTASLHDALRQTVDWIRTA